MGPVRDLRLKDSTPGDSHIHVSLRSLTWPHIPRKFTRQSHLVLAFAPNRLFQRPGTAFPVGSIPIIRSTSRLASGPVGTRDSCPHVDPVGKRWERTSIWRRCRVLRCPYAAPAFTRTVTRGDFENILCDSHTLCVAAIMFAGGRIRPEGDGRERRVSGSLFRRRATSRC
jgi:hypothetical protein